MTFKLLCADQLARRGQLHIKDKIIETPTFVPQAPFSRENSLTSAELIKCQITMINVDLIPLLWRYRLTNHRPPITLPHLLGWEGAIIANLGQAQQLKGNVIQVSRAGLKVRSPVDGKVFFYSPEDYMKLQFELAADMIVTFNYPYMPPNHQKEADKTIELNLEWAQICNQMSQGETNALLAAIPIMDTAPLPQRYRDSLLSHPYMGYSLELMDPGSVAQDSISLPLLNLIDALPKQGLRYLRLSASATAILDAIAAGIDVIQSPAPLLKAYRGELFTLCGIIQISDEQYKKFDQRPIDKHCKCYTCLHFSRAYLHYLYLNHIMLGSRLNMVHNVYFFQELMLNIRSAIERGQFKQTIGELSRSLKKLPLA